MTQWMHISGWSALDSNDQLYWMVALVFSLLWLIQGLLNWTHTPEENKSSRHDPLAFYRFSADQVIGGLALWGWVSITGYTLAASTLLGAGWLTLAILARVVGEAQQWLAKRRVARESLVMYN